VPYAQLERSAARGADATEQLQRVDPHSCVAPLGSDGLRWSSCHWINPPASLHGACASSRDMLLPSPRRTPGSALETRTRTPRRSRCPWTPSSQSA
jgi:hypothetical protein